MKAHLLTLLVPLAFLAACGRSKLPPDSPEATTSTTATNAPAVPANATPSAAAQVTLSGLPTGAAAPAGNGVTTIGGNLQLVLVEGGVKINGQVTGLARNTEHGIHVHQSGDCSATDFKSAGEHFNPDGAMHGSPTSNPHHLGDLPSIKSDANGTATVDTLVAGATLADGGAHDLLGKSVIVHAMPDDYKTQPSGNSGARIACGVIEKLP